MKSINKDTIAGSCITVFAIIIFISTFAIRHLTVSRISSAFAPRLVAIGLFLLGITILLQGLSNSNTVSKGNTFKTSVLSTFLAILVYVTLLESLGFLVMNTIYLIAQFWILIPGKDRKFPVIIGTAIGLSVAIYMVFVYGFQLYLPTGILG